MSAPTNGYSIRLVYYGRADLVKQIYGHDDENGKWVKGHFEDVPAPQVSTQNIRIVAFSSADPESFDYIGIYELVKNAEAPKSDLEGTKI